MEAIKQQTFIIDGSSFLYRAYYSIPHLTTKEGIPVGAVYGFVRMTKKLIDTYNPSMVVLVWDSKGPTKRHELYEDYKKTRQAAPGDLSFQKGLIKKFADIIGLRQLELEGIEADDLMYSLAKKLEAKQIDSIMITSDKDMHQALSEHVTIFDPFKNRLITVETAEEKYGFSLSKLPFYYALTGDSSDNIPGVRSIGPKTATKLVTQFDSLDELYQGLDTVESPRTRQLLETGKDSAYLSKKLFLLRSYETYLSPEDCTFTPEDWDNAYKFFKELDFKTLLKTVKTPKDEPDSLSACELAEKYEFKSVQTLEDLNAVVKQIQKKGFCALDTEGTGLDPLTSELTGLSLCCQEGIAFYIPFGHRTDEQQLSLEIALPLLKPLLEDPAIEKYLHHAKYDALHLWHHGISLQGIVFDTLLAATLLVKDGQRKGLKHLSEYYLCEPMIHFGDVVKKKKYPNFSYVPLKEATEYAAADAHQTFKLFELFQKQLKEEKLDKLFYELEMPLLTILLDMERTGIKLDQSVITRINQHVSCELEKIRTQVVDFVGHEYASINLNSPKQIEDLLFNHLKLPPLKKTAQKTGFSTDHQVLYELSKIHPVPEMIIQYRELFKLKSTYLDTLGTFVNTNTNRIHTTFSQTVVATGRLSSSSPNLQNIPVDSFAVRSAFRADEGNLFLSADYSQIELRVLGYLSQDKMLESAFDKEKDIHAVTAAELFNVPIDKVTSEQRQVGKRINFSILYGKTAHGLAQELEVKYSVAREYIDRFFSAYPEVTPWMDSVIQSAVANGYVQTLWGRRRYLPGIYDRNRTIQQMARRVAINTVVQGTAAELVKKGMILLDGEIKRQNLDAKLILQIHDELLVEAPANEIEKVEAVVKSALENVTSWNIPLKVTTRVGLSWQDVTK